MVQGLMALTSVRRRFRLMFFAGLSALLIAVPVLPANASVNTWTSARLYGGTVHGLAASPANPSIVLAGTGGAGVFRSTDGGVRWHRSSTDMPHDTVGFTFAFAPSAPDTVFAGTYASGVYRPGMPVVGLAGSVSAILAAAGRFPAGLMRSGRP